MSGNGGINVTMTTVNSGFDYYINDKNSLSFNASYKPLVQNIDLLSETLLVQKR